MNLNRKGAQTLVLSILPVIVFALIENYFGTVAGLIAGVVLGIGELVYERVTLGRIQGVTLAANALVIALGALSLFEDDPTFFKLQPAILVFAMAAFFIGSSLVKRPMLVELAKKQRPDLPPVALQSLSGLNFRVGMFLILVGAIGVHAALKWSTPLWAAYKAAGAPVALVLYVFLDLLIQKKFRN